MPTTIEHSLQPSAVGWLSRADRSAQESQPTDDQPPRVAYIMSRFPKLTETFILFEIKALEELGVPVEIYPLWRERAKVMHDEAKPYVARAHFRRLFSPRVVRANLRYLCKSPRRYLATLILGLKANWGSPRFLIGFLAAFPKAVLFAEEMTAAKIQHVHAHFASHPAAAAFVIRQLAGIPYSFTAHGSDLHRDVHMLREKVDEAAFVVAISGFNQGRILDECGAEAGDKVRVIHCGTDLRVFRPRGEHAAPETETLQLACIGTLHEVKGQRYLIEAGRILQQRGVSFRLHLVGNGPDATELEALSEHCGVRDQVEFHGGLKRPEVAMLLSDMHVVVAPSVPTRDGRREGIPVALMEAMASGLPVVASHLTGIPELVQDRVNGRLVSPRDPVAIADAVEELARQPELRIAWGQAARRSIECQFDLQQNAHLLLSTIRGATAATAERSSHAIGQQVLP